MIVDLFFFFFFFFISFTRRTNTRNRISSRHERNNTRFVPLIFTLRFRDTESGGGEAGLKSFQRAQVIKPLPFIKRSDKKASLFNIPVVHSGDHIMQVRINCSPIEFPLHKADPRICSYNVISSPDIR